MKTVLIFCEGKHDILFVQRSLGALAQGSWLGGPIASLPFPLGPLPNPRDPQTPISKGWLVTRLQDREIASLPLRGALHASAPTPESIVQDPGSDTLFVLLRSGSKDAARAATEQVRDLISMAALQQPGRHSFAAAFLFDADQDGVSQRAAAFAAAHSLLFASAGGPGHLGWAPAVVDGVRVPFGLFVFHEAQTQRGTLEDILGPLVEAEWPAAWRGADAFLQAHAAPTDPVATKPAERAKAQITITGQLRCPGDPMSQVLHHSVLPARHFHGPASRALVDFLRAVPW